jgi:RNA polymerase sigma-70 factor, ECF subfamily
MLEAALTQPTEQNNTISDDELARAALGNPEAFSKLYARYAPRLFHYLYSKAGNRADAEDLTAQVFIEVIESLPRYRQAGYFAAWIFTIARRRAADFYRRKHSWQSCDELDQLANPDSDPLDEVLRNERYQHLRNLLATLDETDYELLRLRFSGELNYHEIARVLGRNEAAVRKTMQRLLRRLEENYE